MASVGSRPGRDGGYAVGLRFRASGAPRIRAICRTPAAGLLGACKKSSGRLTQQFPPQRLKSFQHLLLSVAHLAEQGSVVAYHAL